jgi:Hydrolases of the alpha/beta superfamily
MHVWILVSSVLICLLAGAAGSWWLGAELIGPVNHPVHLPADLQAKHLAIAARNHDIAATWVDSGAGTPAVLLLHSIRADRSAMVTRTRLLTASGFSVLLIDMQAHGETPGETITLGLRESGDARASLQWLRDLRPSRRVGVVGCSLGGAAVLLGPQPAGYDAVVLEAVYPRVYRAIENRVRIRLGSVAPLLTPLFIAQLPLRLHVAPKDLEPIRSIARLGAPVLVVAGSRDEHTTLAESTELFAAAAEPKELWVLQGATHEDFLAFDPDEYTAHVVSFLRRYLWPASQPGELRESYRQISLTRSRP